MSLTAFAMPSAVFAQEASSTPVRGEPPLAAVAVSIQGGYGFYQSAHGGWTDEDRNLGYGVLGRALLTWRLSRPLAMRAGIVLGYALMSFESSICGSDSTGGPT